MFTLGRAWYFATKSACDWAKNYLPYLASRQNQSSHAHSFHSQTARRFSASVQYPMPSQENDALAWTFRLHTGTSMNIRLQMPECKWTMNISLQAPLCKCTCTTHQHWPASASMQMRVRYSSTLACKCKYANARALLIDISLQVPLGEEY